ncbi:AraC family transcriptional regulator [Paenibacillus hemerocallicola]|uniref:AraC family transcriptional regulator n=1 Tax=Paenibacillus hemerocallicola TaxID=1172614 RepID=A0A5C4T8L6_9BACL|nr:helix-turn-helix domain-containing protein [Paenibacillus hemerocallicola]TNJ65433.1 AraC family transcriptional regulator [Paenibacillus hemerocallicola]
MTALPSHGKKRTLLLLSSIRKFRQWNTYVLRRHPVPAPMLCFVVEGKGTLYVNDAACPLEPRRLYYIPPGTTAKASSDNEAGEYYVLIARTIALSRCKGSWGVSEASEATCLPLHSGLVGVRDTERVLSRIEELYETAKSGTASTRPDPDLLLQSLIEYVMRDLSEQAAEREAEQQAGQEAGRASDGGIDPCVVYMHRHYTEKMSRETLADIAGLTPNAFCRSFKRTIGLSPTDYLNKVRIDRAKERLSPDSSVKEVAASVGYGSEYYFSRIFKKTVGLSPTLFIKRERLRVAVASRCGFHDNLASMGVAPAAAVDCYKYPGMDDAEYNRRLQSQLGQLRLVKPDLIIADYFHHGLYDSLKQIAPCVVLKHHLDWRVTHTNIAGLVGREKEADSTFRELEERTTEASRRLRSSDRLGSVAVMQLLPTVIRLQGSVNHPLNELLYAELGLEPGAAVPRNKMREEWVADVSPDELPDPESDYLFVYTPGGRKEIGKGTGKWRGAVQTRLIPNWLSMSWTPQGRNAIIDEVIESFAGAR